MPWPEQDDRTISSVKRGHLKSVICGQPTSVLTHPADRHGLLHARAIAVIDKARRPAGRDHASEAVGDIIGQRPVRPADHVAVGS
jgi:hypothetical protein